MDEQCLSYFYYLSPMNESIINVRKEETDGTSEIIDSVNNSLFNGWILRKVQFNAEAANYKVLKTFKYLDIMIIVFFF